MASEAARRALRTIVLTHHDDTLSDPHRYTGKKVSDAHRLVEQLSVIGMHSCEPARLDKQAKKTWHHYQRSALRLFQISYRWRVLACDGCGLRLYVPAHIATYGQLRQFFEQRVAGAEQHRRTIGDPDIYQY